MDLISWGGLSLGYPLNIASMARQGIVRLSEIGPMWTIDRQDKLLKSHQLKSAAVGKFQSNRLNMTMPFADMGDVRRGHR
jgi:hypothetical protein